MIKKGQGENVVKLLCNFMETTPSTGCWSHVVSVLGELALVEGDMLAGVTSSVDDWAPHTITGSSSGSSRRGEAPSGSDAATSSNNHAGEAALMQCFVTSTAVCRHTEPHTICCKEGSY